MVKIIRAGELVTFVKKIVDYYITSSEATITANSACLECQFSKPIGEEDFSKEFRKSLEEVKDSLISTGYFDMTYPLEGKFALSMLFTYSRYVEVR